MDNTIHNLSNIYEIKTQFTLKQSSQDNFSFLLHLKNYCLDYLFISDWSFNIPRCNVSKFSKVSTIHVCDLNIRPAKTNLNRTPLPNFIPPPDFFLVSSKLLQETHEWIHREYKCRFTEWIKTMVCSLIFLCAYYGFLWVLPTTWIISYFKVFHIESVEKQNKR